jgi:hypothetical protein
VGLQDEWKLRSDPAASRGIHRANLSNAKSAMHLCILILLLLPPSSTPLRPSIPRATSVMHKRSRRVTTHFRRSGRHVGIPFPARDRGWASPMEDAYDAPKISVSPS